MIETSIVIPSYRRPEDLQRAITSVLAQQEVDLSQEVVVVDNDPESSARPVLHKMTQRGCKMVWCAEAVIWETVPADRLASRSVLRQVFRGGQTTTFACTTVRPREVRRGLSG